MPLLRTLAVSFALLWLCNSPAAALDLFATHEVTVQFATTDGKPMADAEVSVYAPGEPGHVVKTGKTDKDGKFTFGADRDGFWTAEAKINGDVARASIRVGGANEERGGPSPFLLIGGLLVLLAMAVGFRFLRARARARSRGRGQGS
jgi:hypothetical protein